MGRKKRTLKPQQPVEKAHSAYLATYKRLLAEFDQQRATLQEVRQQVAQNSERQLCLVDLILHQDLCLQLLREDAARLLGADAIEPEHQGLQVASVQEQHIPGVKLECSINNHAGELCQSDSSASDDRRQPSGTCNGTCDRCLAAKQQNAAEQTSLQQPSFQQQQELAEPLLQQSDPAVGSLAAGSYVTQLLQTAEVRDLELVRSMTPANWLEHMHELFLRLVVLLELADRLPAPDVGPANALTLQQELQEQQQDGLVNGSMQTNPAAAATADASGPPAYGFIQGCDPYSSLQQITTLIDQTVLLVVLGYCFNHVPVLEACAYSYATRTRSTPPPGHWKMVADRLRLSEHQQLHFAIAAQEYARLQAAAAQEGSQLSSSSNQDSLYLAAAAATAQQQHQQHLGHKQRVQNHQQQQRRRNGSASEQQQQQGEQDGSSSSSSSNHLDAQLQRHVSSRHLQLRMIAMFYINTLSRLQLAQLVVASFPYISSFTGIAAIVAKDYQQQQQQGINPQQQQQHLSAPAAGLRSLMAVQSQQHMAIRSRALQQQHSMWWQQQQQQLVEQQLSSLFSSR